MNRPDTPPVPRRWSFRAAEPRLLLRAGTLAAALVSLVGCAARDDEPLLLPPVTVTGAGPSAAPAGGPAPAAPSSAASRASSRPAGATEDGEEQANEDAKEDPTMVVLGEGDREAAPSSTREMLQKAARDARQNRERSGEPVLVLNDENLAAHAEGGRVTLGLADPPPLADTSVLDEVAEKEAYWKERVLDIRTRWREAYDSIDPLESEAAKLRTRFYSEDDPVRRDREIKPMWDRTLDRLAEARRTLDTAREELAIAYEEGRADGALPGWLREGNELGPFEPEEPAEGEQLEELSATEPTIVEAQSLEPPI